MDVVVDHTDVLHERVHTRGPECRESDPLPQLGELVRATRRRRRPHRLSSRSWPHSSSRRDDRDGRALSPSTDWGSFGLPLEGTNGSETRAGAHARTDVPRCRPGDRLRDVCEQLDESGWDSCFVVDERGVVLGRIGRRAIRGREDVSAARR
jgi:hypothetical protein